MAPCEEWIRRLHIKREEYHGGSFNGNDCHKLLKNTNILEQIAPSPSVKVKACVDAFKAFNGVVTSCYNNVLSSDYQQNINQFKKDTRN